MSSSADAPAMSTGTTMANAPAGASSRAHAPAAPPAAVMTASRTARCRCPVSSGREPATDPADVQTSDTVFVTLAASGGSPIASSTG